jgi:cholesterol transport system auxiliary component
MAYAAEKRLARRGAWGLLLAAALMLTACVGGQAPVLVKQWILDYPPPALPGLKPLDASLKLERFSAAAGYLSPEMVYSPSPNERAVYPYDRWRVSPADLVGDLFLRDLRACGLFTAIWAPAQRGPARFKLEGGVEKFLEVDEAKGWRAELTLTLTLLDTKEKRLPGLVVFQKDYQKSLPITEKSAAGLSAAMSRVLAQLSAEFIKDVHQAMSKRLP